MAGKKKNNSERSIRKIITRCVSGVVLLALLVVVLFTGGDLLFFSSVALSIVGLVELYRVFGLANSRIGFIGYIFTIVYYISIYYYKISGILFFLIGALLLLFAFYVCSYPRFKIQQVAQVLLGIIYVGIMFSFVYLIREQRGNAGKYLVWLIFISSWGCDTCAYATGMLVGRHKFLPLLSPKKTIEGCIGGVLGSALLGIIYVYFVYGKIIRGDIVLGYTRIAIACAMGAIISQIGDLTASAIKRDYGIKDYGDIIPGHGGILDRFDSVIFTAPCFYFIFYMYS